MTIALANPYVLGIWLLFFLYWLAAWLYDITTKKHKHAERIHSSWNTIIERLLFVIALIMVLTNVSYLLYPFGIQLLSQSRTYTYVGFAVGILGILFAIWARIHLGGNWSGTIMLKKGHTLTTSGPYNIVRNPIYAGILLAVVGSAITEGTLGSVIAIVLTAAFAYIRCKTEEQLMREKFGKAYDAYAKRTKALIPFIW